MAPSSRRSSKNSNTPTQFTGVACEMSIELKVAEVSELINVAYEVRPTKVKKTVPTPSVSDS